MNPAKLIIRDYLIRRWWVWVLVLPLSLFFMGVACLDRANQHHSYIPFIFVLGSLMLIVDLQRGCARALLSLPISPKELARVWRWEALGLPFIISTLFNYLGFLIYCLFKGSWDLFPIFTLYNLGNLLVIGVMYFVLTGLPAAQQQGATPLVHAKAGLFGFLWGGGFTGMYFFAMWGKASSPLGQLLIAIAVILSVWGWFRADLLVQERAGFRLAVQKGGETKDDSRCAEGGGGLLFLMQLLVARMILTGFFVMCVFGVIFGLKAPYFVSHMDSQLREQFSSILVGNPIFFPMVGMIIATLFLPVCMQTRFLRTLPCSASRLAAFMILTPLFGLLTIFAVTGLLLAAALHQPLLSVLEALPVLPCALLIFLVPLVVWIGWGVVSYISFVVLMLGSIMVAGIGQIHHWFQLAPSISLALSALLVVMAFLLSKLALERSSRTYRPRFVNPYGGVNWGGGR